MNKYERDIADYQARNIKEVALAINKQADINKEVSEKEIASKNRVDIELAVYEEMKEKIKKLESENTHLKRYFYNILKGLDDTSGNVLWSLLMNGSDYKVHKFTDYLPEKRSRCIGFSTTFVVSEFELKDIEERVGKWE